MKISFSANSCLRILSAPLYRVSIVLAFAAMPSLASANYVQSDVPFEDIDVSQTENVILEECDECYRVVDLGFEYTYYGRLYTQVYVHINGFVVMSVDDSALCLSADRTRFICNQGRDIQLTPEDTGTVDELTDELVGVISPWWGDLTSSEPLVDDGSGVEVNATPDIAEEEGKVYAKRTGSAGNFVYVIQWKNVRHFFNAQSTEANSFQIKLFQNKNLIEFHYSNIVSNGGIQTIGIESPRQDEGVKFFRTASSLALPANTQPFAIRFSPPEGETITGSTRYSAEGNRFKHVFRIDGENIKLDSDLPQPSVVLDSGSLSDPDEDSFAVTSFTPAEFSLEYETLGSLSSEPAGTVSGQYIEVTANGNAYKFDSQTILVTQDKEVANSDDALASNVAMNSDASVIAFKTSTDLFEGTGTCDKNTSVSDVFFSGFDPDTGASETHQLTCLGSSTESCGPPFVDTFEIEGNDQTYVYVMCHEAAGAEAVQVYRYDINSYLDDDLDELVEIVANSKSDFSENVETLARVVAGGSKVVFAKSNDAGKQDIYLSQDIGLDTLSKLSSLAGELKSLAVSSGGDQAVYVLDESAYFYKTSEVLIDNNSHAIDISADGSLIALGSANDLAGNNADGSQEVFIVATNALSTFSQKTDLTDGKSCRLPRLSETGFRLALVCDDDLLGLNAFVNRDAVFIIEGDASDSISHLITSDSTGNEAITDLSMSDNGARVSFHEDKSYALAGLSNLSHESVVFGDKTYPEAYESGGSGKSGAMQVILLLIAFSFGIKFTFKKYKLFA